MYAYLKGEVSRITPQNVVVEVQGIGYLLYVANPYSYKIGQEILVHIYQHVREDEISLYGFQDVTQKELFMDLISVKGIGPKTALVILAATRVEEFQRAVVNKDVTYLSKFPKIGKKSAQQMILDLEKKYENIGITSDNLVAGTSSEELLDALISLGYDKQAVNKVAKKIDLSLSLEDQIKEGLKLLLKI